MLTLLFQVLFIAHIFACAWFFVSSQVEFTSPGSPTWIQLRKHVHPPNPDGNPVAWANSGTASGTRFFRQLDHRQSEGAAGSAGALTQCAGRAQGQRVSP